METLQLKKPILVNGEEITEIEFDLENLKALDRFKSVRDYADTGNYINVEETEKLYLISIFARSVNKINSKITLEDLLRLGIPDTKVVTTTIRDLFLNSGDDNIDSEDVITFDLKSELTLLSGENIKKFEFDLNELTAGDEVKISKSLKQKGYIVVNETTDPMYLINILILAINKNQSKKITYNDLMSMSFIDSVKLTKVARSFFMKIQDTE